MPTEETREQIVERPPEPRSKSFIVDSNGYKRIIRKSKPNEPPFSNSYVAGNIEADLLSAYQSLCHAYSTLKNSGLSRLHLDGKGPFGHIKALLSFSLMLGSHMLGDKDGVQLKEYVSKINVVEEWNDGFPIINVEETPEGEFIV